MAAERKKVMTGATIEEDTVIIKNLVKVLHPDMCLQVVIKTYMYIHACTYVHACITTACIFCAFVLHRNIAGL